MTSIEIETFARQIGHEMAHHKSAIMAECHLHRVVALALDGLKIAYEKEVVLGPKERLDFLLTKTGIAIELKKKKAGIHAWRQVGRYLEHDRVTGCIIIAPRVDRGLTTMAGKPIAMIPIWKFL